MKPELTTGDLRVSITFLIKIEKLLKMTKRLSRILLFLLKIKKVKWDLEPRPEDKEFLCSLNL